MKKPSLEQDEMITSIMFVVMIGTVVLAFLPAIPFLLVFLSLWKIFRVKWWYLVLMATVIFFALICTGIAREMFSNYIEVLKAVIIAYKEDHFNFGTLKWVHILPVAALIGFGGSTIIIAIIDGWSKLANPYARRTMSKTVSAQIKPFTDWWGKKALQKISKEKHPEFGTILGLNQETGNPVIFTDKELNQHCLIFGTTGSGKTTTIMNLVESAISRNIPLILIDGKGAIDLAEKVKFFAEYYNRPFYLFAMQGDSWHYNPLARGGITELKDRLISLTEWSEEHYKKMAERYLQLVFRCFEVTEEKVDMVTLAGFLDPNNLALLARGITDADERENIFNALESFKDPEIRGLAARIAVMTESEIGYLFKDKPGKTIDLERTVDENAVVVFLLDSLSFPEYSRLLGRLIVTDLKSVAARQLTDGRKKIYTIFDEFNVFASSAVVDLISKTRSFGFHTVIGTQSPSDLERVGGTALVEQVVENCNSFIIQRQNSAINAEKLAAVIGTNDSYEVTYQIQDSGIFTKGRTGMGSVRQTREFIIHPDQLKRLGTGEAILVRKAGSFQVEKIKVRRPE